MTIAYNMWTTCMIDLKKPLVFVDVETTGGKPEQDGIIEIGLIKRYPDGREESFQSLIRPARYVPDWILRYTNISMNELEQAPLFREVSDEIYSFLEDSIFIAHNVRFDYGFVRSAFRSIGFTYTAPHFCTAKLSKMLFPMERSHSLDALATRHNLHIPHRHRALDDARAMFDYFKKLEAIFPEDVLLEACTRLQKRTMVPIEVMEKVNGALPESCGVYLFYGEDGLPLYVGMSKNIHTRILQHFSANLREYKELRITDTTKSIDTIDMAGVLGSQLLEAHLIKELQPLYNRQLRGQKQYTLIRKDESKPYTTVSIEYADEIDPSEIHGIWGIAKSKRQAKQLVQSTAEKHMLCQHILGIDTSSPCFAYKLQKCRGACVGAESTLLHNVRTEMAFSGLKLKQWRFDEPQIVRERSEELGFEDVFTVDNWRIIEAKRYSLETGETIEMPYTASNSFSLDTYKILVRYFFQKLKRTSGRRI